MAVLLVATAAAVGCGGSGGGEGGGEAALTGICETCDSDVDCEAGLSCQPCLTGCTDAPKRCVGFASQNGPSVSCDGGSYPGGCANIAGDWTLTEELNGECVIAGDDIPLDQSGTATARFNQNGCDVSYRVPQLDLQRTGTIVGNRMRLSGPFLTVVDASVDVDFAENRAALEGTVTGNHMSLMGEGNARGNIEGEDLSCSGMSLAEGFR